MPRNGFRVSVLVGAVALMVAAGCGKRPPKAPPVEEPVPTVETPPPPPPKPKCEGLDEKCVGDTEAKMPAGSNGIITPPLGWHYAKESAASVAVSTEGDGVLGVAQADGKDPDKILAALTKLLDRFEITDVKLPALKPRLKKAQSTVPTGGVELSLWEVDKTRQGKEPKMKGNAGTLLVIVAPLSDSNIVVGAGFVSNTADPSRVSSIMDSLKTLRGKP